MSEYPYTDYKEGDLIRIDLAIFSDRYGRITESIFGIFKRTNFVGKSDYPESIVIDQIIGIENFVKDPKLNFSLQERTITRSDLEGVGCYFNGHIENR